MSFSSFGKSDLHDIISFQNRNGIKLPQDYVDFLLKHNGGVADSEKNNIFIEDFDEYINVDVLFGIKNDNPELTIQLWLDDYKMDMPKDTIIVGDSYQHGFIILICSGKGKGVYYWDHAYEFPNSNDEMNTYFVADTFTDFIKHLL